MILVVLVGKSKDVAIVVVRTAVDEPSWANKHAVPGHRSVIGMIPWTRRVFPEARARVLNLTADSAVKWLEQG